MAALPAATMLPERARHVRRSPRGPTSRRAAGTAAARSRSTGVARSPGRLARSEQRWRSAHLAERSAHIHRQLSRNGLPLTATAMVPTPARWPAEWCLAVHRLAQAVKVVGPPARWNASCTLRPSPGGRRQSRMGRVVEPASRVSCITHDTEVCAGRPAAVTSEQVTIHEKAE